MPNPTLVDRFINGISETIRVGIFLLVGQLV